MSRQGSQRSRGKKEKEHKLKDDLELFPKAVNTLAPASSRKSSGLGSRASALSGGLTSTSVSSGRSGEHVNAWIKSTSPYSSAGLTDSEKTMGSISISKESSGTTDYSSTHVPSSGGSGISGFSASALSGTVPAPPRTTRSWSQINDEAESSSDDDMYRSSATKSGGRSGTAQTATSSSQSRPIKGRRSTDVPPSSSRQKSMTRISSREEAIAKATGRSGSSRSSGGSKGKSKDRGSMSRSGPRSGRSRGGSSSNGNNNGSGRGGRGGDSRSGGGDSSRDWRDSGDYRRSSSGIALRGGPDGSSSRGGWNHGSSRRGGESDYHPPSSRGGGSGSGGGRGYRSMQDSVDEAEAARLEESVQRAFNDSSMMSGKYDSYAEDSAPPIRSRTIDGKRPKFTVKLVGCDSTELTGSDSSSGRKGSGRSGKSSRSGRGDHRKRERPRRQSRLQMSALEIREKTAVIAGKDSGTSKKTRFPTRMERSRDKSGEASGSSKKGGGSAAGGGRGSLGSGGRGSGRAGTLTDVQLIPTRRTRFESMLVEIQQYLDSKKANVAEFQRLREEFDSKQAENFKKEMTERNGRVTGGGGSSERGRGSDGKTTQSVVGEPASVSTSVTVTASTTPKTTTSGIIPSQTTTAIPGISTADAGVTLGVPGSASMVGLSGVGLSGARAPQTTASVLTGFTMPSAFSSRTISSGPSLRQAVATTRIPRSIFGQPGVMAVQTSQESSATDARLAAEKSGTGGSPPMHTIGTTMGIPGSMVGSVPVTTAPPGSGVSTSSAGMSAMFKPTASAPSALSAASVPGATQVTPTLSSTTPSIASLSAAALSGDTSAMGALAGLQKTLQDAIHSGKLTSDQQKLAAIQVQQIQVQQIKVLHTMQQRAQLVQAQAFASAAAQLQLKQQHQAAVAAAAAAHQQQQQHEHQQRVQAEHARQQQILAQQTFNQTQGWGDDYAQYQVMPSMGYTDPSSTVATSGPGTATTSVSPYPMWTTHIRRPADTTDEYQ